MSERDVMPGPNGATLNVVQTGYCILVFMVAA